LPAVTLLGAAFTRRTCLAEATSLPSQKEDPLKETYLLQRGKAAAPFKKFIAPNCEHNPIKKKGRQFGSLELLNITKIIALLKMGLHQRSAGVRSLLVKASYFSQIELRPFRE
jgi:hypothetical protein